MDNLARDSIAALAAGMSYGKWKALQEQKPIMPRQEKDVYSEFKKKCEWCGTEFMFSRKTQRFCCMSCYHKDYYQRKRKVHG